MAELYSLSLTEAAKLSEEDFCRVRFPERTKRAARMARREDALRCLGAGALIAGVLGAEERELTFGEYGKPALPPGRPFFNLSHSGDYILLAVDRAPVGVDIEKSDDRHLSAARVICTPEERSWMAVDPVPRFHTLWTMKESVLKQMGCGIRRAPGSFSVLPLIAGQALEDFGTPLYAVSGELEGCRIALCTVSPAPLPRLRSVTAEELTGGAFCNEI